MATVLKFLIKWPNREELQKTIPTDFVQVYGQKFAGIIDCFEVFIECPGDLLAPVHLLRAILKCHNTKSVDKYLSSRGHFLNT